MQLAALRLGCLQALEAPTFCRATFVTDSLAALLDIGRWQRGSSLVVEIRTLLTSSSTSRGAVRLWHAPSHPSASATATVAASHASATTGELLPLCPSTLRGAIRRVYRDHASTQWDLSDLGRDLHAVEPLAHCTLQWTRHLSRREVALVAQFLTGHYATNMYLLRFGHDTDGSCDWCEASIDDRHHRLLECPHYAPVRHHLMTRIHAEGGGSIAWTWDYLTGPGRPTLARFLQAVAHMTADLVG